MVYGITKVFYFGALVVRITNFGVDSYILVESINRAATGKPFFDDEYKQLAEDVVKYGQEYEGKAVELESANAELNNLYDVLTILGNIAEAYEAKIETWNKRIEHLEKLFDDLRERLGERFYLTWFSQSFISRAAHSQVSSDEIKKRLGEAKGGGWMAVRITLSSLAVTWGAYLFYDMYKDWKAWRAEQQPQERVWVRRMAIVRPPAMGRFARFRRAFGAFYRRYKYHIGFFASSAFLALTIYMLTKELNQLKDAKGEMRKQINSYKRQTEGFGIVLNGTTDEPTEEQIKLLKEILNAEDRQQIDFSQAADKKALKLGFRGIVKKYDQNVEDILNDINNVYKGAIEFLTDKNFQQEINVEIETQNQEREKQLADCKKAQKEFDAKNTEQKELQKQGKSADRKSKIVEIANSFKTTVLDRLDSALTIVDSCIELLTMQNTIMVSVKRWLKQAKERPPITDDRKEEVIDLLNAAYPNRTQLQDEDSISKYLNKLVDLLWEKKQSEETKQSG